MSGNFNNVEIELLEPEDGGISAPLQQHCWPITTGDNNATAKKVFLPIAWDSLSKSEEEDRSLPRAITFRWRPLTVNKHNLRYDFHLATDAAFRHSFQTNNLTEPQLEICHLHLATRYYWKVIAHREEEIIAESPVGTITTHDELPRWILVPGITNVRDMGGWPLAQGGKIRQGMVYRTSELNGHLAITAEGERILLDELKIRTDIDLRGAGESPAAALAGEQVQWINIPVRPYDGIIDEGELGKAAYRKIFAIFAKAENYPLFFHCWGGADRAGTVAFLLGALLGMTAEQLIKDYELTSLSVWGPRQSGSDEFTGLLRALSANDFESFTIGEQVERYLVSIGVSEKEIAAIRTILIEQPTSPTKEKI